MVEIAEAKSIYVGECVYYCACMCAVAVLNMYVFIALVAGLIDNIIAREDHRSVNDYIVAGPVMAVTNSQQPSLFQFTF